MNNFYILISIIFTICIIIQTVCLISLEINRQRVKSKDEKFIDLQILYTSKLLERIINDR